MQTAVEWLIDKIVQDQMYKAISQKEWIEIFEQAKEMEINQIIKAFNKGAMQPQRMGTNYFNETYGSKGSDDQVPDVRKMVEDDNYLTPVDWLMDRIKWINRETYDYLIKEGHYDVAKRTENAILDKTNEMISSQTEISDEEIEKIINPNKLEKIPESWKSFIDGAKWAINKLKNK